MCLIQTDWIVGNLLCFAMIARAYSNDCLNASIASTDGHNNQSFQWAVGVENITININYASRYLKRSLLYINHDKNGSTVRLARWYYGEKSEKLNIYNTSLATVTALYTTKITFRINILKPNLFNESSIQIFDRSEYCCCLTYSTPNISIQYCPKVTNLDFTKPLEKEDRVYGRKAILQCNNTVFVQNSTITGRYTTVVCNKFAQWEGPIPECYQGKVLDMNNAAKEQTFKHNTSLLLFCDLFNTKMDNISISFRNRTHIRNKFVWVRLILTAVDHDKLVTCHQTSHDQHRSQSRAVKLHVQFPPLIPPNMIVSSSVTLYQDGYVEFKFKSNPTISGHSAVTAFIQGKEVGNIYYVTNHTENKVVLHFTNVTERDLGQYLIVIKSPETHEVKLIVTANNETGTDSRNAAVESDSISSTVAALIAVLCCAIVVALLLSFKIGNDWTKNRSQNKDKKSSSTARYSVAPNEKEVSISTVGRPNRPGPSQRMGMRSANTSRYMDMKPKYPMESEIYELPVANQYK